MWEKVIGKTHHLLIYQRITHIKKNDIHTMKKLIISLIGVTVAILAIVGIWQHQTNKQRDDEPADADHSYTYVSDAGYSITVPFTYKMSDVTPALLQRSDLPHVSFIVPESYATGTNLRAASHIGVAVDYQAEICDAAVFLGNKDVMGKPIQTKLVTEKGITYSVGGFFDAATGGRYDETAYAVVGSKPCIAIMYDIFWTDMGFFEPGAVKEFDREALIREFDAIRRTLTITDRK